MGPAVLHLQDQALMAEQPVDVLATRCHAICLAGTFRTLFCTVTRMLSPALLVEVASSPSAICIRRSRLFQ